MRRVNNEEGTISFFVDAKPGAGVDSAETLAESGYNFHHFAHIKPRPTLRYTKEIHYDLYFLLLLDSTRMVLVMVFPFPFRARVPGFHLLLLITFLYCTTE